MNCITTVSTFLFIDQKKLVFCHLVQILQKIILYMQTWKKNTCFQVPKIIINF